ncbi:MAG: hypothetical protein J6S50_00590 [Oscillospiraceae bacterium]|nr:hypothetical protein [Oscillospiraceae bacterium]MBO7726999.1 hypothetical protein [Oscillospiraceae bacterium]MBP5281063.1 hypothetical protein [Lachnospiraceae bacterium]
MDKRAIDELLDINDRVIKANEELIKVNENAMKIIGDLVALLKVKAVTGGRNKVTDEQTGDRP